MTLTNYWWLLIWIVVAGGILTWVFPQKQVKVLGKMEYRWNWLAAIILASPYAIWSMNRSNFGDTEVYRRTFFRCSAIFWGVHLLTYRIIQKIKDLQF